MTKALSLILKDDDTYYWSLAARGEAKRYSYEYASANVDLTEVIEKFL